MVHGCTQPLGFGSAISHSSCVYGAPSMAHALSSAGFLGNSPWLARSLNSCAFCVGSSTLLPGQWGPLQCRNCQPLPTWVSLSLTCPCQSLKDLPDVSAPDTQLCRSCLCCSCLCSRCGRRGSCSVTLASRWWAWGKRRCDNRSGGLGKWVTGGSRRVMGRG